MKVKGIINKEQAFVVRFYVDDEDLFANYVPILGTECEKQQYGEQQLALLYMHMFWYTQSATNSCVHMYSDTYDEREIWLYLSDANEIQKTITEFESRFPICKHLDTFNCHTYSMHLNNMPGEVDVAIGGDYIY